MAVALHGCKLSGASNLSTAIQIAQLALKHRQNKNQRQRIVAFVGSPLDQVDQANLVKLGKKMKKNNVAIDVVSFGETEENEVKLNAFVEAVNSSDNSHLLTVPPGMDLLLSDAILSSPILAEDGGGPVASGSGAGGAGSGPGSGGADGDGFAVDPNLDPELAMVSQTLRDISWYSTEHGLRCRPCACLWKTNELDKLLLQVLALLQFRRRKQQQHQPPQQQHQPLLRH